MWFTHTEFRFYILSLILFSAISAFAEEKTDLFTASGVGALSSVEEALSHDYGVNSTDALGNTALLLASENGHLPVVKYLIRLGADVNLRNIYGYSPLFASVVNAHAEIIQYLLENGADIRLENTYGTTPEDYINALGYKDAGEYIEALLLSAAQGKTGPNTHRYLRKPGMNSAENIAEEEIPGDSAPPDNVTADTLYRLGKSLTDGVTPKDPVLGNEYLKKAYAMGDIRAAVLYGRSFLMGTGVFLNYAKAAELFNLGVMKGNEDAKFFLGLMKYFGMGLPLDKEEGFWDISSAAANGSVYAEEYLKIVATEDILEYLSLPHKREEIKTYLLSAGASLKASEGLCDLYDLRGAVSRDYALTAAKVCAGAVKQNIIFEHLDDIDPLYKARITRYAETEAYSLIPLRN
jgi:hypothetical protein